jgi:tetratricopeptide (TPR) repeat protein
MDAGAASARARGRVGTRATEPDDRRRTPRSRRVLPAWLVTAGLIGVVLSAALAAQQLEPVDPPPLGAFEAAVADHIREAHAAVAALDSSRAGARELAAAYGELGRVYHAYGLFEPAEAAYRNAARLAPRDARWPHLLGYLYQQTGRFEEAVRALETARSLAPEQRVLEARLAETYLSLNRLTEARALFERIVESFPAVARHGLGEVALRLGQFDEAISHFQFVLERVPGATAVHYQLAMAYRGLGRLDHAKKHLERRGSGTVWAADPVVDALQTLVRGERALLMLGRRAYEAGQFAAAADAFRRAIEAAPESPSARVGLGLALAQLGKADAAREEFQRALALDPGDVGAHAGLGQLLAREGRDGEAVEHLRAAFDQAPADAVVRADLVRALLRLGRDEAAIEVLVRAMSADPDDEDTVVLLAILLADRGRFRDAIAVLDQSHNRFPDRPATATTLARLLASAPDSSVRDGARALELALTVHAFDPAPAHAETVALALAELERCGEAAAWLQKAIEAAVGAGDKDEAARLRRERPNYETARCRPSRR